MLNLHDLTAVQNWKTIAGLFMLGKRELMGLQSAATLLALSP